MEVSAEPIRVQSLAQAGVTQVPSQYVQPPQYRPNQPSSSTNIPLINLFGLDPTRRDSVRESIGEACREWGAFHVTNHGVPTGLVDAMKRAGLSFFNDSSVEDKLKYACDPRSSVSEGYGSRMLEKDDTVLDWRDYINHHTLPLKRRDPKRWPHFPANYRQVVSEYSDHMAALARELLGLISESLGLETRRLEEAVGEFWQNIVFSYYPLCLQPELALGLQAHSDMGAITLLVQDEVGSLEVLKAGDWVPVKPVAGDAIVVLLADQTQVITNGKYKSAEHRALTNSSQARLSVATFHDPAKMAKLSPAVELISESTPPLYREVVYGDFVSSWYTKGPEGIYRTNQIDGLIEFVQALDCFDLLGPKVICGFIRKMNVKFLSTQRVGLIFAVYF